MSTRGWYEYHVLNPGTRQRSLAMQFYKWGDATPENALLEWKMLHEQIESSEGLLPVVWLDDMLREQLGELYDRLPEQFSVAAFLFLIQRANEERSPFKGWDYQKLEKLDRPDYRLGFALGKAMGKNGFRPLEHSDPLLNDVLAFIAAGHFVRPWKEYALTWPVLRWLQYLTQVTLAHDMGSIAGGLVAPLDISYLHRFFIWVDPAEAFRIKRLAVELCGRDGSNLLATMENARRDDRLDVVSELELAAELRCQIAELGVDLCTMDDLAAEYSQAPDYFWGPSCHERPPLTDAMRQAIREGCV